MACARIVALSGVSGSGKDAIANVLCEGGATNLKFARPLKDCLASLFELSSEHLDGRLRDAPLERWGGVTPRALLQWFGTEVMQHGLASAVPGVGRRFWADKLVEKARQEVLLNQNHRQDDDGGLVVVVSDLRFQHELDALSEAFGDRLVTVRVERPPVDRSAGTPSEEISTHESETASATLDVDLVLANDGTLEDLERATRRLLRFGSVAWFEGRPVRLVSARRGRILYRELGQQQQQQQLGDQDGENSNRSCSAIRWIQGGSAPRPVVFT